VRPSLKQRLTLISREDTLDQKSKKAGRDLSDLKAKLGIAKPGGDAVPAPGAAPPAPGVVAPGAPAQPAPGVVAPPGMAPPQAPAQPAPPDTSRNPFAATAPMSMAPPQVITDAGPLVEIPEEKKSPMKLIIVLVITALIPLCVGWACGRIYGARMLFNRTIEDAARIKAATVQIIATNKKLATIITESRTKNGNKVVYDPNLVENLKDILRASPHANPEKAKKRQDALFRTNYAMMEDITISRLFSYYNNTLRLYQTIESFLQKTGRNKLMIEEFSKASAGADKKYGVVFASDEGRYYLGQLVEVGNIVCDDPQTRECSKTEIKGFKVRSNFTGTWSDRIGKPSDSNEKFTDIIVPIIPDQTWRSVATGKKGRLAFQDYKRGYLTMSAILSLLIRVEKTLVQDLGKAAGREKLFAPL
jgi:hypothetical protein